MAWFVYVIREVPTDRCYVGMTHKPANRWAAHVMSLALGRHQNMLLQIAWDASSPEAFVFEIVAADLTKAAALILERDLTVELLAISRCFNIAVGNDCHTHHPLREALTELRADYVRARMASLTPQERKQMCGRPGAQNGMFGRKHTAAVRKRLSKMHKGNTYAKGSKRSAATRARLSEIAKGRTGERNPFFGKTHSDSTRRTISEAMVGRKPTNRRRVIVRGKVFDSVTDVAKAEFVTPNAIIYKLKSPNWPDYQYEAENA